MEKAEMQLVELDSTDIIATSGPVLLPGQIRISNSSNSITNDVVFSSANGSSKTFSSDYGITVGDYVSFFDAFSNVSGINVNQFYSKGEDGRYSFSLIYPSGSSSGKLTLNILYYDAIDDGSGTNFNGVYEWNSEKSAWYQQ